MSERHWVSYLRVSTTAQDEKGIGLEVQAAATEKWAAEHGVTIQRAYVDVCSGAIIDRPNLGELIVDVQAHQIEGIIVYRLDRIAREVILQELLLTQFTAGGALVRSTSDAETSVLDDPLLDADPSRKLIRVILGAVGEYERSLIRLRTQSAKRRLAAQGKYVGGWMGNGWHKEPGTGRKALLPELVPLVEQGLRMRELGVPFDAIGEFWFQAGFPPAIDNHTGKQSPKWSPTAVRRKLTQAESRGYKPRPLTAQAALFTGGAR